MDVTVGPNSTDNKPVDKDAWPELPMPRDSHMLPEHSQQLLRAARSGRVYKPPAPPEEDNEMKDEEEESKEVQVGFTVKKYVKVARHLEAPEREYLAKRRKGLPSPYVNGQVAQTALRETKVKKQDAEGNVAVYKVLVPEGQAVEGEVQPTDAAIELAPEAAAPGTVVEGVGIVNAEGVVVANDILQQTPPRRRPPPPKKKKVRGGPGRKKKTVGFVGGAAEHGTPASTASSDALAVPGLKQEESLLAASDGGDTPMADVGGEDEEGSGEEGSGDEDHDMDTTPAPPTPARSTPAPTSAPALENADIIGNGLPSTDALPVLESSVAVSVETSQPSDTTMAEMAEASSEIPEATERKMRRASSSPDLPLSHSRQNSLNQIPTSATTMELAPEAEPVEPMALDPQTGPVSEAPVNLVPEPVIETPAQPNVPPTDDHVSEPLIEASVEVAEPVPVPAIEPVSEPIIEAVSPVLEPVVEAVAEPVPEAASELAPEIVVEISTESLAAPVAETVTEPLPEPIAELVSVPTEDAQSDAMPAGISEPVAESISTPKAPAIERVLEASESARVPESLPVPEVRSPAGVEPQVEPVVPVDQPSAPPSEPDLLGSLERQLEKDNKDIENA